jgi:hypothetical protein
VVRLALRTYRERFRLVALTALVVFGLVGAIDAIAVVLVVDDHVARPLGALLTSTLAAVFAMAGVVIYAGVLDKVVGAHLHGHPDLSLREILSVLPLRRLAVADVLFAIVIAAALAVFVLPAVFLFIPALCLNGLLGAVVGSIVGLVEVILAYELIAADAP